MKIYGYKKNGSDALLRLEEVSIQATPVEIHCLAVFLQETAVQMERAGDTFDHEHFQDYSRDRHIDRAQGEPDVILARKRNKDSRPL